MAKKNGAFWESALLNVATFKQYYNRLVEMAISTFKWNNLPETVDPRFLELTLFCEGQAVFFWDEVLGYLTLQNAQGGSFNVYRVPNVRRAYAVNGYQKNLNETDSVLIYNNYLHTASRLDAEMFAKRLYNLDRAIDVNANAQKTPIMILCDESQRLSMLNLYKQFEGNEPYIFGENALKAGNVQVLNTGAPFVADQLYDLKTKIWNEALTYLGITNVSVQKKERMISDEVMRMQGGTIACRYSRLNARQDACRQINEMFGLDISCEFREDLTEKSEGENVEVYN